MIPMSSTTPAREEGPLARKMEAVRMSIESVGSAHALDESFEQDEPVRRASSQNTADETANLNIIDVSGPIYADVEGQEAFKRTDRRVDKDRSYRRLILTVIRGRAMPLGPLFISLAWSVIAVLISWATRRDFDGETCRWWCTPLAVDGDALSYVGFALFLLTSFRVSEAYGRYMEAARVWTNISGTTTSFAKYVVQAFPNGMIHKGDTQRILSFLVAYPISLKRELRGERDLRELKNVLTAADMARLQNAESMSAYCLYVLSGYMLKAREKESQFPQTFIVHLIRWISDLAGAADVCMQIKTMPAPYSYVTLPFAIVEKMGWGTIVIVAFISYGILGVVSNAAELEDPFGSDFNDLPLGKMAQKIQDQVAVIYHACEKGSGTFVGESRDDDLHRHAEYWLNNSECDTKQEGSHKHGATKQI